MGVKKTTMFAFVLKKLIVFYRYFISPLKAPSCRYYPSCSSYALQSLKTKNIFYACFSIALRILRCNPLFSGGIDYPIVYKNIKTKPYEKNFKLKYIYIPCGGKRFLIIKSLD